MAAKLDKSQKERLIEEVRRFPHFYNPGHKDHKNRNAVENSWQTIAKNVEIPETTCKSAWESLRDYYHQVLRKLKKPIPSGSETQPKPPTWPFFNQLNFLSDFYVLREGSGNVTDLKSEDTESFTDNQSEFGDDNSVTTESDLRSTDSPLSASTPTIKRPRLIKSAVNPKDVAFMEALKGQKDDEFDIFGANVAATIRSLPTKFAQIQAKKKINDVITQCELDAFAPTTDSFDEGNVSTSAAYSSAMESLNKSQYY